MRVLNPAAPEGRVMQGILNPQYPAIYDEFRVLGTVIAKQEDE